MPEDLQQVILIVLGESEIPRTATGRMSNVGKFLSRCGQANTSRKTTCSGHPKGTQADWHSKFDTFAWPGVERRGSNGAPSPKSLKNEPQKLPEKAFAHGKCAKQTQMNFANSKFKREATTTPPNA